jgi:hypothetical protein
MLALNYLLELAGSGSLAAGSFWVIVGLVRTPGRDGARRDVSPAWR